MHLAILSIFYFFPPTMEKNLCRDPSTIDYTENGLVAGSARNQCTPFGHVSQWI